MRGGGQETWSLTRKPKTKENMPDPRQISTGGSKIGKRKGREGLEGPTEEWKGVVRRSGDTIGEGRRKKGVFEEKHGWRLRRNIGPSRCTK